MRTTARTTPTNHISGHLLLPKERVSIIVHLLHVFGLAATMVELVTIRPENYEAARVGTDYEPDFVLNSDFIPRT